MRESTGRVSLPLLLSAVVVVSTISGCRSGAAKAASAATHPSRADGTSFQHDHFSLVYPNGWTSRKGDDPHDVLTIDAKAGDQNGAEVTVTVPHLPPHIPGIIPLPAVEDGYVKDVKKRMSNVNEAQSKHVKIDGADARRFVITGQKDKQDRKMVVITSVKGDHLYIISGEAPLDRYSTVRSAVDQVVQTWKWK